VDREELELEKEDESQELMEDMPEQIHGTHNSVPM
jgi:hypothetical protein